MLEHDEGGHWVVLVVALARPFEVPEVAFSFAGTGRLVVKLSVPTHSDQLFRLIPISCSD
jgi:hypothetical protein